MQITFYNNNSEREKVGKTLINVRELNGELKDNCDVVEPILLVSGDNLSQYNYLYIPSFNRYYFITKIKVIRNNLWEVYTHCDVLESYKNEIKNQIGVVARQENTWDMYLNDGTFKADSTDKTATLLFPNDLFTTPSYVFAVAGDYDFIEGEE